MDESPASILDAWQREENCLAPLSQKQWTVIKRLERLCKDDAISGNDQTDRQDDGDRGTTNNNGLGRIAQLEEFDEWFSDVEKEYESTSNAKYVQMMMYYDECRQLLSYVTNSLDDLKSLESHYKSVSSKALTLHNACDSLIEQQNGLTAAVEKIDQKVDYFRELTSMSKKLSTPSVLILSESLVPMLKRLDECIVFLEEKPNYKESANYLQQYRYLQSQAVHTIKNHVINTLQQTAEQVKPQSTQILAQSDSVFTLFYGKFQNHSQRIKSLMQLVEEREHQSKLYNQYLTECHQVYFNVRETLMMPILSMAIDNMVTSHKQNYCALTRNSCTMVMHICRDEHQLFYQFFTKPADLLKEFLEKLCIKLYDVLRPIIIHMNHLETLSEMCTIIKTDVIDDFVVKHSEKLEVYGSVMHQMLEDIQERLIYRTNIYIQTNIINYSPASGDLAYPEKLEMMEKIAECLAATNQTANRPLSRSSSVSSLVSDTLSDVSLSTAERTADKFNRSQYTGSPADIHGMWYPTVRRTIMCLSKLHRSLDTAIFQGLAQEVVSACLKSLEDATQLISKRKTPIDGQLFLVKHLLILREQIAPFQMECIFREVSIDFTAIKSAAMDLIHKRENLFSLTTNNSLLKFFFEVPGAPKIIDQVSDPRKIVDHNIKTSCERFITMSTEILLSPALRFMNLVKAVERVNGASIRSQNFTSVQNVKMVGDEIFANLKLRLPVLRRSMSLYLANRDTQDILFRPIHVNVTKKCEEFIKFVNTCYTEEERGQIGCPSKEQMESIVDSIELNK